MVLSEVRGSEVEVRGWAVVVSEVRGSEVEVRG